MRGIPLNGGNIAFIVGPEGIVAIAINALPVTQVIQQAKPKATAQAQVIQSPSLGPVIQTSYPLAVPQVTKDLLYTTAAAATVFRDSKWHNFTLDEPVVSSITYAGFSNSYVTATFNISLPSSGWQIEFLRDAVGQVWSGYQEAATATYNKLLWSATGYYYRFYKAGVGYKPAVLITTPIPSPAPTASFGSLTVDGGYNYSIPVTVNKVSGINVAYRYDMVLTSITDVITTQTDVEWYNSGSGFVDSLGINYKQKVITVKAYHAYGYQSSLLSLIASAEYTVTRS